MFTRNVYSFFIINAAILYSKYVQRYKCSYLMENISLIHVANEMHRSVSFSTE